MFFLCELFTLRPLFPRRTACQSGGWLSSSFHKVVVVVVVYGSLVTGATLVVDVVLVEVRAQASARWACPVQIHCASRAHASRDDPGSTYVVPNSETLSARYCFAVQCSAVRGCLQLVHQRVRLVLRAGDLRTLALAVDARGVGEAVLLDGEPTPLRLGHLLLIHSLDPIVLVLGVVRLVVQQHLVCRGRYAV